MSNPTVSCRVMSDAEQCARKDGALLWSLGLQLALNSHGLSSLTKVLDPEKDIWSFPDVEFGNGQNQVSVDHHLSDFELHRTKLTGVSLCVE